MQPGVLGVNQLKDLSDTAANTLKLLLKADPERAPFFVSQRPSSLLLAGVRIAKKHFPE